MKNITVYDVKRNITCKMIVLGAGLLAGFGVGTAVGLGVKCKIKKTLTPAKKSAVVALETLGVLMTNLSENLKQS